MNTLLLTKMIKKSYHYIFCFHKWVCVEEILMILNVWLFDRRWWIVWKMAWYDSKSVDDKKYLKIETNSYEGKIKTSFFEKAIPKEGSHDIYLSVTSLINAVFEIVKTIIHMCF